MRLVLICSRTTSVKDGPSVIHTSTVMVAFDHTSRLKLESGDTITAWTYAEPQNLLDVTLEM